MGPRINQLNKANAHCHLSPPLQSGTGADERMHIKSKAEEESMRKALSELDPRGS